MSGVRLFFIVFICMDLSKCSGITNYESDKNLIGEEERRGVTIKEDDGIRDNKKLESTKRGLWLIAQPHHASGYDTSGTETGYHGSTGPGGYGYVDSGGYGASGSGYNYASEGGGYYKGPSLGYGYGYSGAGSTFGHGGGSTFGHGGGSTYGHGGGSYFGHGGINYGHSGYEEPGHEVSHGHGGYNKLALKKLLIPLAGLALLGAAAALSSNPVLLQLGSIQSGRRKRSLTSESETSSSNVRVYPLNPWTRPLYNN